MKTKKLIIYGVGNLAEYIAYVFEQDSEYEVIAFCVEENYYNKFENKIYSNKLLLNFDEMCQKGLNEDEYIFIAVGNNQVRKRIFITSEQSGFNFANYISNRASYWPNLVYGKNVFLGEGSIVHPYAKFENNIICFAVFLGHHSIVESHSLLSSCSFGGNVLVGEETFVGMGAVVNQNVKLGKNNIIGASSQISKSTEDNSVYTNTSTEKRTISADRIKNIYLQ